MLSSIQSSVTIPPQWRDQNFTSIVLQRVFVVSSRYFPVEARTQIPDKGSLTKSLDNHDLKFLYEKPLDLPSVGLLTKIEKVLVCLGIYLIAPPLGVVWHASYAVSHTITWIKSKDSKEGRLIKHHIINTLEHLFPAVITYFIFQALSYKKLRRVLLLPEYLLNNKEVLLRAKLLLFGPLSPACVLLYCMHIPGFSIMAPEKLSFLLRKRFGVTGKHGWPLSFTAMHIYNPSQLDLEKDKHIDQLKLVFKGLWANYMLNYKDAITTLNISLTDKERRFYAENPYKLDTLLENYKKNHPEEAQKTQDFLDQSKKYQQAVNNVKGLATQLSRYAFFLHEENNYQYFDIRPPKSPFENIPTNKHTESFLGCLRDVQELPDDDTSLPLTTKIKELDLKSDPVALALNTLELKPSPTQQQIKKAYIRLSLVYHSDKNPHPEATSLFQALREAKEFLEEELKNSDKIIL